MLTNDNLPRILFKLGYNLSNFEFLALFKKNRSKIMSKVSHLKVLINFFLSEFQSGLWADLSSPHFLVFSAVLLPCVSIKVKFNLNFISEDPIGLRFYHTHIPFLLNEYSIFSKSYRRLYRTNDKCS